MNQTVESIYNLSTTDNNNSNTADTAPLLIGCLKIYGRKVFRLFSGYFDIIARMRSFI